MGYSTRFELFMFDASWSKLQDSDFALIMADLFGQVEEARYALDDNGESYDATKWNDHVPEMKQFSLRWPAVVFELEGRGEENGDLWHKYFQNGKVQICKAIITFDSFDPEKLA